MEKASTIETKGEKYEKSPEVDKLSKFGQKKNDCQTQKHMVKCAKVKAAVWTIPLKQASTEPHDGNKDNQGGFQTGQYLWDSGLYLARWILLNRESIRGKHIVELGSGLGLPGLIAAKFAATTLLTDYVQDIVSNLSASIKANEQSTKPIVPGTCRAVILDWVEVVKSRA